jgi:DNA-binding NarL/FixJ family response regulator
VGVPKDYSLAGPAAEHVGKARALDPFGRASAPSPYFTPAAVSGHPQLTRDRSTEAARRGIQPSQFRRLSDRLRPLMQRSARCAALQCVFPPPSAVTTRRWTKARRVRAGRPAGPAQAVSCSRIRRAKACTRRRARSRRATRCSHPSVTRRLIERHLHLIQPSTELVTRLARMTEREREVLTLVARGLSNAQIATTLHLGEATVRTHIAKAGARDRAQAVVFATSRDWFAPGTSRVPDHAYAWRRCVACFLKSCCRLCRCCT